MVNRQSRYSHSSTMNFRSLESMIEYYSIVRRLVEIRYDGHRQYLKTGHYMLHYAIVYIRSKGNYVVLAVGMNTPEVHAETVAVKLFLKTSRKLTINTKPNLIVLRTSRTGTILNSKPCAKCVNMLSRKHLSDTFKRIEYSERIGSLTHIRRSNIKTLVKDPDMHCGYKMMDEIEVAINKQYI